MSLRLWLVYLVLVVPGCPHHVTQWGNRRGQTFFEDGDYQLYKDLLREAARKAGGDLVLLPDAEPRSPDYGAWR